MKIPEISVPITKLPLEKNIQLFIKREDLIHPTVSGNKYWKLFYNISNYLQQNPEKPLIITYGGAYSNHIAAVAALGKDHRIATIGIIRGNELEHKWQANPTLRQAHADGMKFRFVTRESYRDKAELSEILRKEFPGALIIPEGGTNDFAVLGVQHMLSDATKSFDYLCTAVGSGGTAAGLSKFAEPLQKVIGFAVVKDSSLQERINGLSGIENFELIESADGGYGKISEENVRFINSFTAKYGIQLDPLYTGKMMMKLFELIEADYFPEGSRLLAFHTGGLQGIEGANLLLRKSDRPQIIVNGH